MILAPGWEKRMRVNRFQNFKEFIEFCKANFVHPYIELKKDASTNYEDIQGLYEIVCAEACSRMYPGFPLIMIICSG